MFSVLMTILSVLKVIGIILLVLLALIILIVCLILFGPVRFRAGVTYEEALTADGSVSWLGFVLRILFRYEDGLDFSVKVCGIQICPRKEKEGRKAPVTGTPQPPEAEEIKRAKPVQQHLPEAEQPPESGTSMEEPGGAAAGEPQFSADHPQAEVQTTSDVFVREAKGQEVQASPEASVQEDTALSEVPAQETQASSEAAAQEAKVQSGRDEIHKEPQQRKQRKKEKQQEKEKQPKQKKQKKDKQPKSEKPHSEFSGSSGTLQKVREVVGDEDFGEAVGRAFSILGEFFGSIRFRELSGDVSFSLGSPDYTGLVTGVMSTFPVFYGQDLSITPDFESEKMYFRGTLAGGGSLKLIHLVIAAVKLVTDKKLKKIMHLIRK